MSRLRGAHLTMPHNGKEPECIEGFQGGSGVCGYWGQVSRRENLGKLPCVAMG